MGLKIVSIKSSFPNKSETLNSKKYKNIIKATGINKRYLSSEKECNKFIYKICKKNFK